MEKILLSSFILMIILVGGCGQEKKSTSSSPNKPETKFGISLFQFPDGTLSAKEGDFVLAPPEKLVQEALQKKRYFSFSRRNVLKVGSKESYLKKKDREEKIPNILIIPLGSNQGAQLGDIVLTSNHIDKHLMTRGIVAEGGTEQEPKVHYLEIRELSRLDNRKHKLQAGTFRVLKSPGEPGSELLCKKKENFAGVTLINNTADLYLAKDSLGFVKVYNKADCEPLPLKPQVKTGDKVFVPIGSFYQEGKVKKVEDNFGRLYVEYTFGKIIKERTFPYGVVATTEPGRERERETERERERETELNSR